MDRAALIARLRNFHLYLTDKDRTEISNALEADAKKEAALKALCDEYRELPGFADIIRMFRATLAERGANDKHE